MIQSNFVDMEKMLALFKYDQSVKDAPDATELIVSQGTVEFGEYRPYSNECIVLCCHNWMVSMIIRRG